MALSDLNFAINLKKEYADAIFNKSRVLAVLGETEESLNTIEMAINLRPNGNYYLGALAYARLNVCNWNDYESILKRMDKAVQRGQIVASPFEAQGIFESIQLIQKVGSRQAQGNIRNSHESLKNTSNVPNNGKICLAFVSADFREHAMGYNFRGFFQKINRDKFSLIAISLKRAKDSPMQQQFRQIFDRFYDVDDMSNLEIVQFVRNLNCDIAVDLMGDTNMSRQNLFSARLAPIQVN